jgi:DNA mismatch repair protein MutH
MELTMFINLWRKPFYMFVSCAHFLFFNISVTWNSQHVHNSLAQAVLHVRFMCTFFIF